MIVIRAVRAAGFSIVELMVTIAIVAILAAIAGPSIDQLTRRTKLDADTERFQSAMAYARSEAIKRSTTVSMVPSATGFSGGWRIITDDGTQNPNCTLSTAQGEEVLRVQDALSPTTTYVVGTDAGTGTGPVDCDTAPTTVNACISYKAGGASVATGGGFLAQTMCLRDNINPTTMYRVITLNSTGQGFLVKVAR